MATTESSSSSSPATSSRPASPFNGLEASPEPAPVRRHVSPPREGDIKVPEPSTKPVKVSENDRRTELAATSGQLKSQITPRAVTGSQNPSIPTPEMRDFFEPQLRSKEWIERLLVVKIASVCFVLYHIGLVGYSLRESGSQSALAWKLGACLAGIYLADLITGLLHIYLDHRRCDIGDPLDMAAYSFRYDHHALPLNFLKDSPFFPAGASNIVSSVTTPISLVVHAAAYYHRATLLNDSGCEMKFLVALMVVIFGSMCQTTHALAHEGRSQRNKTFPKIIAFLQKYHLILPPHVHGRHHQDEHDRNFCIFNGWANPLLNALSPYFFAGMRAAPGHFDSLAVPGPDSWASQQKRREAAEGVPTTAHSKAE